MGLGDIFKATKNRELKAENERLNLLLTPEMQDLNNVLIKIEEKKSRLVCVKKLSFKKKLKSSVVS